MRGVRRACFAAAVGSAAVAGEAGRAGAQMPGVPVLQNAFTNPGTTFGIDAGFAPSANGAPTTAAYGAAAAWAPASGTFQLSLGVGVMTPKDAKTFTEYGVRVAVPLTRFFGSGSFGVAPFAGIGQGRRDTASVMLAPVGVAVGYRRALGATRGLSVYAAPFYAYNRVTVSGETVTRALIRVSAGLDVALVRRIGLTLGYEGGRAAGEGRPGAQGSVFGAGLSYAFR